jgi:hypothetical protein
MRAAGGSDSQEEPVENATDFPPPPSPFSFDDDPILIDGDEDDDGPDPPSDAEDEVEILPKAGYKRKFDSIEATMLWMKSAAPSGGKLSNSGVDAWIKLMNDERYRLQEVLWEWKSHRDLDKSLLKAAVGEVSRVPTQIAHPAILLLFVFVWYAILRLLIYRSVLFRVLLQFKLSCWISAGRQVDQSAKGGSGSRSYSFVPHSSARSDARTSETRPGSLSSQRSRSRRFVGVRLVRLNLYEDTITRRRAHSGKSRRTG